MWERLNQLIKPNGAIVLFGNQPFTSTLIMSNIKCFKYVWGWDKIIPSGMSYARYRPMSQLEDIIIFTKSGEKSKYYPQMTLRTAPIKGGGMSNSNSAMSNGYKALKKTYTHKNPTTLVAYKKIRNGSVHPTQKPVALMEYLIKTYTNEDEIVLDFTMGSGTTCVAAYNTGRKCIGIEMDDKYFEVAKQRVSDAINTKAAQLF
jgi:site-specific DNA-methyltransferase (adenine-specific)